MVQKFQQYHSTSITFETCFNREPKGTLKSVGPQHASAWMGVREEMETAQLQPVGGFTNFQTFIGTMFPTRHPSVRHPGSGVRSGRPPTKTFRPLRTAWQVSKVHLDCNLFTNFLRVPLQTLKVPCLQRSEVRMLQVCP